MEKENIRRFLRDEAELTGVLFDAYRESEHGEVCVTQINRQRANVFKDMCINFLNKNGIAVRGGYHCAPLAHKKMGTLEIGTSRISVGAFNTKSEAENFCSIVKKHCYGLNKS